MRSIVSSNVLPRPPMNLGRPWQVGVRTEELTGSGLPSPDMDELNRKYIDSLLTHHWQAGVDSGVETIRSLFGIPKVSAPIHHRAELLLFHRFKQLTKLLSPHKRLRLLRQLHLSQPKVRRRQCRGKDEASDSDGEIDESSDDEVDEDNDVGELFFGLERPEVAAAEPSLSPVDVEPHTIEYLLDAADRSAREQVEDLLEAAVQDAGSAEDMHAERASPRPQVVEGLVPRHHCIVVNGQNMHVYTYLRYLWYSGRHGELE